MKTHVEFESPERHNEVFGDLLAILSEVEGIDNTSLERAFLPRIRFSRAKGFSLRNRYSLELEGNFNHLKVYDALENAGYTLGLKWREE